MTAWKVPEGIDLADPSFNVPSKIDILLGAEVFFEALKTGQIKPLENGPLIKETVFGWIVAGSVPVRNSTLLRSFHALRMSLEKIISSPITTEENERVKHFNKTVIRDEEGRFVLKSDYSNSMDEYLRLGHMERVTNNVSPNIKQYYIPHHAVLRECKSTAKLRVVFNASCVTTTGLSLNDVLFKGPVIQDDLFSILTHFQTHQYVLSADCEKMYRQIWVSKDHQDLQRILWKSQPDQPIEEFRLKTVTYGTSPASYLATGCLQ
ncbi:uncharacterized protein LOC126908854 [Daktulosphaira vitifoliae]|uniref:uncharacterized protein LOC126908854 n=1 Tax=Daktulosphaira vitifoliae TaxID=58002 RepID=UPI0021AA6A10|nr:uncharacterized protein LOC126908854 [Daktulosphaira vitifoliae]